MIQRVQTLYLLVVTILVGFFFFVPFSTFVVKPQMVEYLLMATGLSTSGLNQEVIYPIWALLILVILVCTIPFITIFLFKKRMLQIRLCIVSIILLLGLQGLLYYTVVAIGKQLSAEPSYSIIFIFPVISAILTFLALRAIAKDEALVRSLDRLR